MTALLDRLGSLLSNIDSPSGHIFICYTLIWTGAMFFYLGVPKGEDLIVFAMGALGRSMLGDARNGNTQSTTKG